MKIRTNRTHSLRGFTLIEMIGVLAVIAILAALLIPKIFEAIANARVSNASISIGTCKTAIADHYAKFGGLAVDGTAATPTALADTEDFDKILLREGFLDKPFAVKIGDGDDDNNDIQLVTVPATVPALSAANMVYDLDGNNTVDMVAGNKVVQALISSATLEDAAALDRIIDGPELSSAASAGTDTKGRVKWAVGASAGNYNILIHLHHR